MVVANVAGVIAVTACGPVPGPVEVADPVLVLLDQVGLAPVLVDPGPGLVLSLVETVAGAPDVADFILVLVEVVVTDPVLVPLDKVGLAANSILVLDGIHRR